MRRLLAAALALVAVSVAAQSPMYSDYPWGLLQNGVDQGPVWNLNCISPGLACSVDGGNGTVSVNVAGGGGALSDAGFVTWYADPGLTNERVLSAGNYTVADYGTAGQAQVDWQHGLTCSSGQALTTASTSTLACTSTITASDLNCSGCVAMGSEVSGILPEANGGTGTGALTCGTAQYLTSNGTAYSCSQGVNGSGAADYAAYWAGTYALSGESQYRYDSTNNRLQVGSGSCDTGAVNGCATTTYGLVARNAITENGGGSIKAMNSSTTGYSGLDFWDDKDTARQATIAYGGSVHPTTNKRNAFYVDYGSNANGFSVWSDSTLHSRFNSTGLGVGGTPTARLDVASGGVRVAGNLNNASTRPTVAAGTNAYELRGTGNTSTVDDGFLRVSAGGGTNATVKAYIDVSGYSTVADMDSTLVFGTAGVERARISKTGTLALSTPTSGAPLAFPDATTMSTNAGTIYRLASDFPTTSTTFTNVTGLTHAVDAGTAYIFEARIMWQSSSTAGGPGFSLNGPVPLLLSYTVEYQTFANATGGTMTTRHDTGFDAMAALATTTAATTTYVATIRGVYVVSFAGGTLAVRLRSSNAAYTMTAKAGSYLIVRKGNN